MTREKAVLVVAPNNQSRFVSGYLRRDLTLLLKETLEYATLRNLAWLFSGGGEAPKLPDDRVPTNPMSGYYLESYLKLNGYDARAVFDFQKDDELIEALKCDPFAVALSTTFINSKVALVRCLRALRHIVGELPIIVGGPLIWKQHMLMQRPQSTIDELKEFGVDEAEDLLFSPDPDPVLGEVIFIANEFGEHTLLRVLREIEARRFSPQELASVSNLVLPLASGEWHATEHLPEPVDLDRDYTRWDLVDAMPPHAVPVRTNAGCPRRCGFCDYHPLHDQVRFRSVESIREEIDLAKVRGASDFSFSDDDVFISKQRMAEFLGGIRKSGMEIEWSGYFRVDLIDESNIGDVYASGCRAGFCGIESGDAGMLQRMSKGTNPEEIRRGIELASQAGICTLLGIVVGYPGETRESLDNTIALLNELKAGEGAFPSFRIAPLAVPALSPIYSVRLRRQYGLRGRDRNWSHESMTSEEAATRWSEYVFKNVHALPYGYVPAVTLRGRGRSLPISEHPPGLSAQARDEAFRSRHRLTIAFLDGESDQVIQQWFSKLHASLAGSTGNPPGWRQYLADRDLQPGTDPRRRSLAQALVSRRKASKSRCC